MKTLDSKTYYEILEVPADASVRDIKRAYHDALAMYDADALVTYSLFSDKEREDILASIENAFDTLIDERKRVIYNRMLADSGQTVKAVAYGRTGKQIDLVSYALEKSKADSLHCWVQMKSADGKIRSMVDAVCAKEDISGKDLKALRCAFGIEISEIYAMTRISGSMIKNIEEDRFEVLPAEIYLKQFLRSYAEILQLDPQHIMAGYLRYMHQSLS